MDLTLSDSQQAIADLAGTILEDRCPPARLRELERGDDRLAADAWTALAGADLLGLSVPEEAGGTGLGTFEAGLVAQQVGRHAALVPHWPTVAAATALARWGTVDAIDRWVRPAASGTAPLGVALWESGTPGLGGASRSCGSAAGRSGRAPATVATRDGDGWRLHGRLQPVPWARQAAALLVPARVGEHDVVLLAVDPAAPGVTLVDEQVVSLEPACTMTLDDVRVGPEAQVGPVGEPVAWLAQRTAALLAATALGVAEGALALTARHASERHQFGAPIGTFQAVAHRCADAYIDTEAMRLTAWQAAWRLDAGLPADEALAVAAFWVGEGGQRVVHAAQHLHGGIGMDTDYPVHRYFRWAKVLELLSGGATGALLRLGDAIAAAEPEPAAP